MHYRATRFAVGLTGAAAAILTAVAAPAAATATAGPAAGAGAWTADGHDATQSFTNPSEKTLTPATVAKVRARFTVTPKTGQGCPDVTPPLVAGGRIFTPDPGGRDGGLAAYDAATGKQQWRTAFGDWVVSPRDLRVAYGDGRVYVADDECDSYSDPNGDVAAFDAATGKLLWHVFGPSQGYDQIVVARGLVVASGGDGPDGNVTTFAYAPATGKVVWKRNERRQPNGVLASGLLVLNDRDGTRTDAVDVATGRTKWSLDHAVTAVAGLPQSGSLLARVTNDQGVSHLAALDVADGSTRWTAPDGTVAVAAGTVNVAQHDHRVVARRLADGHAVWTRTFAGQDVTANPVLAGGVLYVSALRSGSTTVLALDAKNGRTVSTLAKGDFQGHPVVSGGRVYLTTAKTVRAYGLS